MRVRRQQSGTRVERDHRAVPWIQISIATIASQRQRASRSTSVYCTAWTSASVDYVIMKASKGMCTGLWGQGSRRMSSSTSKQLAGVDFWPELAVFPERSAVISLLSWHGAGSLTPFRDLLHLSTLSLNTDIIR